jgi:four helix bundle protein
MGRLKTEFLERLESFADRVVHVSTELENRHVSRRIIDQIVAAGTSVGANAFEADEAMSRADFVKCMAVSSKELSETTFWLRLIARQEWIPAERLAPLLEEAGELRCVVGTMIARSRRPLPRTNAGS